MEQVCPKSPPARGRIITRRSGSGTRGPALRELTLQSFEESQSPTQSRRFELVRIASSFVVAPVLFAASAVFMWTQPFDASGTIVHQQRQAPKGNVEHASRIGREYSRKFSVEPVAAPLASAPKYVKPAPLAGRPSHSEIGGVRMMSDRRADLERQVYKILKRYGKPIPNGKDLSSAIVTEALAQDYDPVFVAAVIKSESAFNALARSHKGAQGLMQIMPRTGAWLADQAAIPRGRLTDPGHNLKLGITYLKQLEAGYGGNRVLTLIAYNWGPGHVESASTGKRRVPGEVMQYAIKILNDYRRWSSEVG